MLKRPSRWNREDRIATDATVTELIHAHEAHHRSGCPGTAGFQRFVSGAEPDATAASTGDPPSQYPPAHVWRRERGGVLFLRRHADHLSVDETTVQVRSDFHDEHRRLLRENGQHGKRPDDVRLLPAGRPADHLFLHASRIAGLPSGAGPIRGIRVAALPDVRHFFGKT